MKKDAGYLKEFFGVLTAVFTTLDKEGVDVTELH